MRSPCFTLLLICVLFFLSSFAYWQSDAKVVSFTFCINNQQPLKSIIQSVYKLSYWVAVIYGTTNKKIRKSVWFYLSCMKLLCILYSISQFESGWFSSNKINCLRQRLMVRYLSIFPKPGAESLLRAATSRFEKLKRECNRTAMKLDGEECQQANTGTVYHYFLTKVMNTTLQDFLW